MVTVLNQTTEVNQNLIAKDNFSKLHKSEHTIKHSLTDHKCRLIVSDWWTSWLINDWLIIDWLVANVVSSVIDQANVQVFKKPLQHLRHLYIRRAEHQTAKDQFNTSMMRYIGFQVAVIKMINFNDDTLTIFINHWNWGTNQMSIRLGWSQCV